MWVARSSRALAEMAGAAHSRAAIVPFLRGASTMTECRREAQRATI